MAKRFTATEIWSEDWFLDMPAEYKLFWFYMLSACTHSGLFRVNLKSFCTLNEVKITTDLALSLFNKGKVRIREINVATWLVEDFFVYQYGSTFNPNNRVHDSIQKEYEKVGVELTSIRGLKDLKERVKDKDKEKDNTKEVGSKSRNPKKKNEEVEREKIAFDMADQEEQERFTRFKEWLKEDAPRVEQMKQPFSFTEWQKATAEFGKFGDTLKKMHNYQPLLKTNISAYLTLCNWRRKDQIQ